MEFAPDINDGKDIYGNYDWEYYIPLWGSSLMADISFQQGLYFDYVGWILWGVAEGLSLGILSLEALAAKAAMTASAKTAAKTGVSRHYNDLVKAAQKQYPNKAGKIELHHINPKYLGGANNGSLVPLDGAYHQVITNEFRAIHPYGLGPVNEAQSLQIMKDVYSKFPLPPGSGF